MNIGVPMYSQRIPMNTSSYEERTIQRYNNSEDFNTPLSTMGRSFRQEKQVDIALEPHVRPNGPHKHIPRIPFSSNRIHIFSRAHRIFILQDRSYPKVLFIFL